MKQEQYLLLETKTFFQLIFIVMLAWATYTKNQYTHTPKKKQKQTLQKKETP